MAVPIESKVKAGSLGAAVAGLADWVLATYLFPHLNDPTAQALILAAVPGVLSFAGGWLAKHTARPQPPVTPVTPVTPMTPPGGTS